MACAPQSVPRSARSFLTMSPIMAAMLALAGVVLLAHGASLWDGIFLDDHWQRVAARDYGLGFNDLIESATIDFGGRWNRLWWQDRPLVWRYARPVGMLVVKLEYLLCGGNPVGIHACGLAWHWATACLVFALARWGGLNPAWAFLAGVFFVIHPHSTAAMGWTSARNAVVNAFFLAAATLLYAQATQAPDGSNLLATLVRWAGPLFCWVLALLSRETGIIFPLIMAAVDVSVGGWRQIRRRWPIYAVVGALWAAFLFWRLVIFEVDAVPVIYFSRPEGLSYLPWAVSKLLNLLFSLIFQTPMIMGLATAGRLSLEMFVLHGLFVVLLSAVFWWYQRASRGLPGRSVWVLWMVAGFAPVIPVFAAPHFAYLSAIPLAVVMAIVCRSLRGRLRTVFTFLLVAVTLWSLFLYRVAMRGVFRSDQILYADILAQTPRPRPGSRVFLINLPLASIYAPLVLREAWGEPDIEGYTLTLATHPLRMDQPCIVERLNDHQIVVSTPGRPYFSDRPGRMFLNVTRSGGPLTAGTRVSTADFDVEVLDADGDGVRAVRFSFREPLHSERYLFYVCTPVRAAYRLRFPASGEDGGRPASGDEIDRRQADFSGLERGCAAARVAPLAVMLADAIQADLDRLPGDEAAWDRVCRWWLRHDGPALEAELAAYRARYRDWLAEQQALFFIYDTVLKVIRSDLFLTGGGR